MESTTFDEILGLEEQFYENGYQQGLADGAKAGRIEGRTFGLEKGFEKYTESGKLHGRSLIWANRMLQFQSKNNFGKQTDYNPVVENMTGSHRAQIYLPLSLPPLPHNQRLAKHITVLYALAESESLSTENTEEAVSDFDDRLKRAQVKAKVIERMAGEVRGDSDVHDKVISSNDGSIEDVSVLKARH